MSLGGQYGATPQVVVYGPDGTAYGTPAHARAAGVENYSMQRPVGGEMLPGFGHVMPMPSPDMPRFISRPQEFNQYGYSAPQVRQQMGEGMNLQPSDNSIIDSSYLAQLGILNQPQVLSAQADALGSGQTGTLGSGLINVPGSGGKGGGAPLIQDYRNLANRFKTDAAAKAAGMAATGTGDGGGGGSDYTDPNPGWTNMSDAEKAAYYNENPTMAAITQAGQKAFSYTPPGLLQSTFAPDFVRDQEMIAMGLNPNQDFGQGFNYGGDYDSFASDRNIPSTQFQDSVYDYGGGGGGGYDSLSSGSVASSLSDAGYSDTGGYGEGPGGFGDSGGGDSGGGKIVCTAMNHAYGFGSFRNKIWLAYAAKNLTKAHEVGYHALFLPLVAVGYNQGDKMHNRIVRRVLENIARHRSADLRAEMRGTKRDPVGRAYRLILEPLCFAVGKLKGY
jgi:hypothetical protein